MKLWTKVLAPREVMTVYLLSALMCVLFPGPAFAGGGPFGIDSSVTFDESGIFQREYQKALYVIMGVGVVAGAVWEGNQTRLGKTFWKAIDSSMISLISTEVLKVTFTRKRPDETDDPDRFFQGINHDSFPSLEVSSVTAIVTPFILEYRRDHPSVYALELLAGYVMVARVKAHRHWQSDVLAGFAVGTLSGFYAHSRKNPLVLKILPGGFMVGLKKNF